MKCGFDFLSLEEATNEIRRYYAIGKYLVAGLSNGMFVNATLVGEKCYGLSCYATDMAMRFAKEYSADEVDALCKQCREYQTVPGLSMIRMLVESVKNKADRQEIQRQAIANAWTTRQLRDEINHRKRMKHLRHMERTPWVYA